MADNKAKIKALAVEMLNNALPHMEELVEKALTLELLTLIAGMKIATQ